MSSEETKAAPAEAADAPSPATVKTEETKTNAEPAKTESDSTEEAKEESKEAETKTDDGELTRRLQKLALEHQKEYSSERLKVIQADTNSHLSSAKTFQELNLPQYLLDAVFAMGFDRPSAIQEAALPRILADPPRNLIGQAQSGSGKRPHLHLVCSIVLMLIVQQPLRHFVSLQPVN